MFNIIDMELEVRDASLHFCKTYFLQGRNLLNTFLIISRDTYVGYHYMLTVTENHLASSQIQD